MTIVICNIEYLSKKLFLGFVFLFWGFLGFLGFFFFTYTLLLVVLVQSLILLSLFAYADLKNYLTDSNKFIQSKCSISCPRYNFLHEARLKTVAVSILFTMSNYKIGVNLRVTENSNQGGRKYMEDNNSIQFVKNEEGGYEFAYFGIFDGHGGSEASKFVRDNLLTQIKKYDYFWNGDDDQILTAIRNGFLDTQELMWKEVGKINLNSAVTTVFSSII